MILTFGASGFNCLRWAGEFYPEDLPPEWCCDYYANEFDSVYLNHEQLDEISLAMKSLDNDFYLLTENNQEVCRQLEMFKKKGVPRVGVCKYTDSANLQVGQFVLLTGNVTSTDSLLGESQVVLAYHDSVVTNLELKTLIEYLYRQFKAYAHVFVFFAGQAVSASQIKQAQTISDLMDCSTG